MSPERRAKRRIKKYTAEWLTLLGVSSWFEVVHRFVESGTEEDTGILRTAADTTSAWEYRFCKIRWYLPNVATLSKRDLRQLILHELIHGLAASIEQHVPDEHTDHGEYAVETLTQAMWHLRYNA